MVISYIRVELDGHSHASVASFPSTRTGNEATAGRNTTINSAVEKKYAHIALLTP